MNDERDERPTAETDDDARDDDEILRELMALSAVDALDAEDQAHLDVLIADRPDLQAEYRDLLEAAAVLASAEAEEPPPSLRRSVLDAVAAEATLRRVTELGDRLDEADRAAPPARVAAGAPPRGPRRAGRRGGWMLPLLAAAAAAVIVIGAAAVVRRGDDDPPGDRFAAVLDDPDHVVLPFDGEVSALSMIYSADHDAAVLSGSGLEAPAGTDVFELWAFDGETPVRVEIFRPDAAGEVMVYLDGVSIADDARFAITVEPAGGSDAPTSPPVGQTS